MAQFDAAMFEEVCERLENGESLRGILASEDRFPSQRTFFRWVELSEENKQQYARARAKQADALVEEIIQIADDGRNDTYIDEDGRRVVDHDHIQRSRLRVDARKWFAAKVAPRKYGDRLAHTGPDGGPVEGTIRVEFVGNDDDS